MDTPAGEHYFTTRVLTAPPQKLHAMLLEAALRHAKTAQQHWAQSGDGPASEALLRAQEIMAELLRSLRPTASAELVGKVASVYVFIYRSLVLANLLHDEIRLRDAVRLLEIECETWRMVCEEMRHAEVQPPRSEAGHTIPTPKHLSPRPLYEESSSAGFSAEA